MQLGTDLSEILSITKIDATDLQAVLSSQFSTASLVSDTEVQYSSNQGEYALKLVYDKGSLKSVVSGSALTQEILDTLKQQIEKVISSPGEMWYGSNILFSRVPVTGWYRYKDVFQITPVPEGAPRPKQAWGDHPCQLQFKFYRTGQSFLDFRRYEEAIAEIELLLIALVPSVIGRSSRSGNKHWVYVDDDTGAFHSEYLQEGYLATGTFTGGSAFPTTDGVASIELAPYHSLHQSRHAYTLGDVMTIPKELSSLLDAFYGLGQKEKAQFIRAAYWFKHSTAVYGLSQSAAYIALMRSIESLTPPAKGHSQCPECDGRIVPDGTPRCSRCGRPKTSGFVDRFIEFVDEFAPQTEVTQTDRKKFYKMRSSLSHGGKLLLSDTEAGWAMLDPKLAEEWVETDYARRLVQVVFVNWLGRKN